MPDNNTIQDLIIIGAGAAGLSAGIYAGRYRMKAVIISETIGGETALAGKIENYPGVKPLDGFDLMQIMQEQAAALGVKTGLARVEKIARSEHCFTVTTTQGEYFTHGIIFALGAERRRLGLPNEKELTGRGVHYCITCDGPLYRGKTIALVGGGDASIKGLNLAAEYVNKIFLIVRGKEITAEPINLEQMKKLGDKVEVLFETEVKAIVGQDKVEKIVLSRPYNGFNELAIDGLFVEVGAIPNTELAKSLGAKLDAAGYIEADAMMKTNIDGVFAAGDTVNLFGRFKQDITAAAMGAVAATSAYEDRNIHGEVCLWHAKATIS